MEIVYLPHPVDAETKARINAEGKRIIDIIFAPPEAAKPEPEPEPDTKPARGRK